MCQYPVNDALPTCDVGTLDAVSAWETDILDGFVKRDTAHATVVQPDFQPDDPTSVVIQLHGYNDYFFQAHVARAFTDAGIAFYAVDARRAGRSIRRGDLPHFFRDIGEQGQDLTDAVAVAREDIPEAPIVIHGHSTGGLAALAWAADAGDPAALVLNSPFVSSIWTPEDRRRAMLLPLLAKARPTTIVAQAPSRYAARMHVDGGGEWSFDTDWKRPEGTPARAAWTLAVERAHQRVERGLGLDLPVLLAVSETSGPDADDNPRLASQDTVLDVEAIVRLAPSIGSDVTVHRVRDGVHDLTLSAAEVRERYLSYVIAWLRARGL